MNRTERLIEIKKAHQRYADWWLPIDVAAGSVMAPMSCHIFCESLLTYSDKDWFDRWLPDFLERTEKNRMKRCILDNVLGHYLHIRDLNEND